MRISSIARVLVSLVIALCLPQHLAAQQKGDFTVWDSTLHKYKPDLKATGFLPMNMVYESELWGPGANPNEPDLNAVRKAANKYKALGDVLCIDIERWRVFGIDPQSIQANIRRLSAVADAMHQAQPKLKIGFYLLLPVRDYWTPVENKPEKIRAWQQANEALTDLAKHVDVIFPSLYMFYDDIEGWTTYARANIMEAKRYGKPVYPVLWFQYHDSNKLLGGRPIPTAHWRTQLETCRQYADGVIIWGGHKEIWTEQAPWWIETKAFLARIGAGKRPK